MLTRRSLLGSLLGTVATVPFWGRFGFAEGLPQSLTQRLPGFKLSVFGRGEPAGPLEEIWTPCIEQVRINENQQYDIEFVAAGLLAEKPLEIHGCSIWTPDNLRITCRTFDRIYMHPGETLRVTQRINLNGMQCDVDDWQYWAPLGADILRAERGQNLRVLQHIA